MTLRAVLFDLGGTLLHYHDPESDDPQRPFRHVTLQGFRDVLDRLAADGAPVPPFEQAVEAADRHVGQAFQAILAVQGGGSVETPIRSALAEVGLPLDDAQWAALRPTYYAPIGGIVSPRVGARQTLSALHEAGHQLALISNTFWASDFHDSHLADYGLLEFLPVRIYSCDEPHSKPHPAIFQDALAQLGVDAHEAAYVGDRPDVDVQGAQRAGLRGILIRSPYEKTPLDGIHPDAIIDELPELVPALEQLR